MKPCFVHSTVLGIKSGFSSGIFTFASDTGNVALDGSFRWFVSPFYPYIHRGGAFYRGDSNGIFDFHRDYGHADEAVSFRELLY